ncbi:WD40 repeat domain-containing protein [Streptomyces bauhiniae]
MTGNGAPRDDLAEWTALLDACATDRTTLSATALPGAAIADRLCRDGAWLRGCAAAARAGSPLLNGSPLTGPPEDGPVAAALRLLSDKGPPRADRVARAIWHAARAAARLRETTGGDDPGADADIAAAAVWWEAARPSAPGDSAEPALLAEVERNAFRGTHPGLPWTQAEDLVERCSDGPRRRHRSVAAKVLAAGVSPDGVAVLTVDLVQDAAENVLPDPDTMLFSTGLDVLEPSLAAAFSWARAQENFTRGHGMRWRLGGPDGAAAAIPEGTEAGGAAVVALARALDRRRGSLLTRAGEHPHDADPRVVVHAAVRPPAHLHAVPAPPDAVRGALATGHVLLFAPGDGVDPPPVTAGQRRQVREAGDVTQALRRSRRLPRRFVAVACVFTVLLTLGVYWSGTESRARAERDRVATKAEELADRALQRETRPPDQALVNALTAHALAPDAAGSRNALLSAVNRETSISKVVRTTVRGLHALALDDDGRYVAGIDSERRLRVWDTRDASPVEVPAGLREVGAIGFPSDGGALAVATDHGVAQWDPARSTAPRWRSGSAASAVAYSPDGTHLAIGGRDGSVEVQDTGSAKSGRRTSLSEGAPTGLAFTSSGSVLAIGTAKAVRMWEWQSAGRPERSATGLAAPARNLLYAAPCKCFYAISGGRLLALAPGTAKAVRTPVDLPYQAMIAYSASRSSLYLAATNLIGVYSADPKSLGSEDGKRSVAPDYLASTNGGRSEVAVSGDGRHLVTPSSSGGLVLYSLADPDTRYLYVLGAQLVESIPRTPVLLYVTGVYGHARAGLYDPRTRKGARRLVDMGDVTGKQPSAFSPRSRLVAVASTDGRVRVREVEPATFSFGAATELTGPPGQRARVTAFDDAHQELYAAWSREIRVYSVAKPAQPTRRYSITLPGTEQVMAVSPAPDRKSLFVATDQSLYALPYRAGRYRWADRVLLASGVFFQAKALGDGGVVAGAITGALSVYRPRGGGWSELPLAGKADTIGIVRPYGDEIVVTVPEHITVYDSRSGEQIVDMRVRGMLPSALNYDGSSIRTFEDTSSAIAFPLGEAAVLARACALLGKSVPGYVADVWPAAPASVRDRPLCAPGAGR